SAGVVLATRAARTASGIIQRQKQRIAALGVLGVVYAGGFLVIEPIVGASSSLLGLIPVAIAGALFGPETGVVAAVLSAILTAVLWQSTGHLVGEPILTVGGNGLGVVALIGIEAPKMRSAIVAPLVADDGPPIGALVVLLAQRGEYTTSDVAALATYARFVRHVLAMRASSHAAVRPASVGVVTERR